LFSILRKRKLFRDARSARIEQGAGMDQIDFEGACRYTLGRLERELAPQLTYHSIGHTRDDIVPAAARLADLAGVGGADRLLLLTAAHYHDLGFVENYEDHEAVGIRIAAEVLPRFGYTPQQIQVIGNIIGATRLPQSPVTLLKKIMADADLDVFGRDDFWPQNADLRAERAAYGRGEDDPAWYAHQLSSMRSHTYFTSEARRLRDAHKQQNLIEMDQALAQARRQEEANSRADQIARLPTRPFAATPDNSRDTAIALGGVRTRSGSTASST
jgi:uncharacterized protein